MSPVVSSLRDRMLREGPVHYADFVAAALYGPEGFYTTGRGAGQRRDFVTSPETGLLFGAVLARALDSWWVDLGRPDPFLVADCGAGPGTLAVSILTAAPECASALRLILVEVSPAFREMHHERRLPLGEPHELLGPVRPTADRSGMGSAGTDDGTEGWPSSGPLGSTGPWCASVANLPECELHVVFANELLDNLPFDVLQRTAAGWSQVLVGAGSEGFVEVLVEATPEQSRHVDQLVPNASTGQRIPVLVGAKPWIADALGHLLPEGRLVCIDYGAPTAELAERGGDWMRTYRSHRRSTDALADPGDFDITIDVAFDQLSPRPDELVSQADFLTRHGIDGLVGAAGEIWAAQKASGGLAALRARSVGHEANLLRDPTGLGAFTVAQWIRR